MGKIKLLLLPFILFLFLFIGGCDDDGSDIRTMADLNVVIGSGDTYKFVVTVAGEGSAFITKQASNFEISELKKDSVTMNGVYTFKPADGFVGVEEVELEKHTYSYDSELQVNRERIKIKVTVEKSL
ncbi:hypothetical protein M2459_003498 [Parabacteroides sp. PF5-5]|uniref:hypothetical protein n=1 Tax=unclassified Parabacteroides TaxID=2649774 RepID=UPI002473913F|nr:MULTISPECIES: hypothetical protein [unclassified Parabacteroides]MDH6317737.1 hypothetical protein [Parabacteroides sp. PF5-13]MDH6328922.1 hypothetical protein [Parabacteroides sp. PH5-41]MDH6336724.1 hypothetical protein [Parabacteroides sp. PF5-5]MDH6347758.1 hypothetical protein [Parabacteroides sp. PH5-46]MDH6362718.1 hypothetical protein [Parabacteroides sp. PH5-16]